MTDDQTTDTTPETPGNGPESDEHPEPAPEGREGSKAAQEGTDGESDAETFPREYVVKLRQEAADARVKAKDRDTLAERLHLALVAATGRLADPSDLVFDDEHLDNAEALDAAIDELLTRKPHLASRRVVGDVGQGATGGGSDVDLAGILRSAAS